MKTFYLNPTFFCTFSNQLILWWSSLSFVRELRDFLCTKSVCRSNVAEIFTSKMWQKHLYIQIIIPIVQEFFKNPYFINFKTELTKQFPTFQFQFHKSFLFHFSILYIYYLVKSTGWFCKFGLIIKINQETLFEYQKIHKRFAKTKIWIGYWIILTIW